MTIIEMLFKQEVIMLMARHRIYVVCVFLVISGHPLLQCLCLATVFMS